MARMRAMIYPQRAQEALQDDMTEIMKKVIMQVAMESPIRTVGLQADAGVDSNIDDVFNMRAILLVAPEERFDAELKKLLAKEFRKNAVKIKVVDG